ncbi:MAG: glycine cleavage system aminomethyltransferase GcvT, partial [Gammaproteobacteria bacterium]|nr:glycine cleavage system aminomethyltransferase GcvT [Gammaproteobacteria bacterium]
FLRYLLANDVAKLKKDGKALYTCMLNPRGGIIDDLIVYRRESDQYYIVSNAATRDKDLAWIQEQASWFAVEVQERDDLAMIAVQGPNARQKAIPCLPAKLSEAAAGLAVFAACWEEEGEGEMFIARTGYTGEDGFEIILPNEEAPELWNALADAKISPTGLGARDTLRLEAGLCLYGADMDETVSPYASNLGWTVAWEPEQRNFIGRDAIAAERKKGPERILRGLVLLEKGVLRSHQTVLVENADDGELTSGTFSPTLGVAIGFARVPASVTEQVTVQVRNKALPARVVKPPFVRHGKAEVQI